MPKRIKNSRRSLVGVAVLLWSAAFWPSVASAFESVGITTITCGFYPSGTPPTQPPIDGGGVGNLLIRHAPPSQSSPVTKEIIIIGETGEDLPSAPTPFNQRFTPFSDFGPPASRKIRVRLLYRFIESPSSQPVLSAQAVPGSSTGPVVELPVIEGPNPLPFAFEIPKSSVTTGSLQYQIRAQVLQFDAVAGTTTVTIETIYPSTTAANQDPFQTVGVQANQSLLFNSDGGRIVIADANPVDGETVLEIPAGVLKGPTQISIDEVPLNSPIIPPGLPNAISVYRLSAQPAIQGLLQLSLLYPDFEFPVGQDGVVDNTTVPENKTQIAYWDGFMWRRLGGRPNASANTISARISVLNFMAVVPAAPVSAQDRRPPQRIITPNNDTKNDTAVFDIDALTQSVRVEIFDTSGHRVRTIFSSSTLEWDGRDDDGKIVESGVYIYQYEVDGQRVSGLIAVAK